MEVAQQGDLAIADAASLRTTISSSSNE